MKKSLKIMFIVLLFVLTSVNMSMAAEGAVTLTASKTSVAVGDTFTVTMAESYGSEVGAVEANVEYNTSAFELVSNIVSDDGWSNINGGDKTFISVLTNGNSSTGTVTTLTFKALANADSSEIIVKNIKIYDMSGNVLAEPSQQSVKVSVTGGTTTSNATLTGISVTNAPSTTTYTAGSIFDPTGMEITASYSDGTTSTVTSYTYSPSEELTTDDTVVTIYYTENGVTQTATQAITVNAATVQESSDGTTNSTVSDTTTTAATTTTTNSADTTTSTASSLPNTGKKTLIITVGIVALVAISVVTYRKTQKYRGI